jgi:hypothetical protein
MTTAHQFGSQPTTAEKLDRALELIAALSVRLEALEKVAGAEGEDARSPARPSPPDWLSLRAAIGASDYESGGQEFESLRARQTSG